MHYAREVILKTVQYPPPFRNKERPVLTYFRQIFFNGFNINTYKNLTLL